MRSILAALFGDDHETKAHADAAVIEGDEANSLSDRPTLYTVLMSPWASRRACYDARFLPDGPLEAWRAFDELQRRSTSPRNAYRLPREVTGDDGMDGAAAGGRNGGGSWMT